MRLPPSGTMDDTPVGRGRPPSLSAAIRAARLDGAERAQATGDLRDAELARLDLLREMLDPVLAEIPPESTCSTRAWCRAPARASSWI